MRASRTLDSSTDDGQGYVIRLPGPVGEACHLADDLLAQISCREVGIVPKQHLKSGILEHLAVSVQGLGDTVGRTPPLR